MSVLPAAVQREVLARHGVLPDAEYTRTACSYCGESAVIWWPRSWVTGRPYSLPSMGGFAFDHVQPRHLGGADTAENVLLTCETCNKIKGHRSLEWFLSYVHPTRGIVPQVTAEQIRTYLLSTRADTRRDASGDRRQETGDRKFSVALRPKTLTSAGRRFSVRTDLSVRTSDLAVEADLSHRYAHATAESR